MVRASYYRRNGRRTESGKYKSEVTTTLVSMLQKNNIIILTDSSTLRACKELYSKMDEHSRLQCKVYVVEINAHIHYMQKEAYASMGHRARLSVKFIHGDVLEYVQTSTEKITFWADLESSTVPVRLLRQLSTNTHAIGVFSVTARARTLVSTRISNMRKTLKRIYKVDGYTRGTSTMINIFIGSKCISDKNVEYGVKSFLFNRYGNVANLTVQYIGYPKKRDMRQYNFNHLRSCKQIDSTRWQVHLPGNTHPTTALTTLGRGMAWMADSSDGGDLVCEA